MIYINLQLQTLAKDKIECKEREGGVGGFTLLTTNIWEQFPHLNEEQRKDH